MDEQKQKNINNEEQQNEVQTELTPLSPPSTHKKLIIGIVVVFVLVVVGMTGAYFQFVKKDNFNIVSCVAETKQCPDGSYVSRMLDNKCEFAECPAEVAIKDSVPDGWETYRNNEYEFEISLPQDTEGLVVLKRQNENNNLDFVYDAFYGFSSEAYDVLFEVLQKDILSSFSFSLLKYRDNILLKYDSLEGSGATEKANLKKLKNLIEDQKVGNYSATETESEYFDIDSNILALQKYEITQGSTNNRKIRKYEIHKRGQTECIPPDLIYEFFESDYYVIFQITQDKCYNTTLSHPILDQILSTFKFIE